MCNGNKIRVRIIVRKPLLYSVDLNNIERYLNIVKNTDEVIYEEVEGVWECWINRRSSSFFGGMKFDTNKKRYTIIQLR